MRIVQIEDFFHPDAGYQINILSKYMSKYGHEVFIITGEIEKAPEQLASFFGKEDTIFRDNEFYNATGVKIIRLPIVRYVSGRAVFRKGIYDFIDDLKPDILYVHGNDTLVAIQYLLRLRKLKYPLIMDSHMLEMASENRFSKVFHWGYKKFITPIIIKNKITVIRTQDDPYVEKFLGVPLGQAPWISVGSDVLLFYANEKRKMRFREKYSIPASNKVAVYIGKLDEAKGGKILAQAFEKKILVDNGRSVTLIVVGNTSGEYGKEVDKILSRSENQILRFPTQKYIDLAKYYQVADFAVFPRQCSLSFYDAQACRLPVIAEDNNINLDRLSHENGFCFNSESVESLREKIFQLLGMEDVSFEVMASNSYDLVKNNYNYENIAKEYMRVIERVKKV